MQVEVLPTSDLPARTAVWIADRAWAAIAERGVAHVAVSGGGTPAPMLAALARLALPWDRVHVWQVDERIAPDGDPDRNANELEPLRAAGARIHLYDVGAADPEDAAIAYAGDLHVACGGILDVVHLGLGPDGHTASWPPGDPVIGIEDRDVGVSQPYQGRVRLTLTRPAVNRARAICFLVVGASKAAALAGVLRGDATVPASAVRRDGTACFADPPAAGR